MAPTRICVGLLVLLSFVTARTALADSIAPHVQRVRPFDSRLRILVERGMRDSPTFRALATRLEESDVIAILLSDICPPPGIAGRLTFLSASGGVRYVVVRLRPLGSPLLEVAVLAHELQHAVEIAERTSITDEEALAREYGRIGHPSPLLPARTAFDTQAAIDVGYRVHRELDTLADVRNADASGE